MKGAGTDRGGKTGQADRKGVLPPNYSHLIVVLMIMHFDIYTQKVHPSTLTNITIPMKVATDYFANAKFFFSFFHSLIFFGIIHCLHLPTIIHLFVCVL